MAHPAQPRARIAEVSRSLRLVAKTGRTQSSANGFCNELLVGAVLRVVDLLQAHITPALCQTVFGAVRRTERQRMWTLEALIRFWTAVVLRAPKAGR